MDFLRFLYVIMTLWQMSGAKQINITIMVPGIKAFNNLAADFTSRDLTSNQYADAILERDGKVSSDYDYGQMEDPVGPTYPSYAAAYESVTPQYDVPYYVNNTPIDDCAQLESDENVIECYYDQYYYTYPWSYIFAKPALDIALETINKTEGLLDGYDIQLRYYDCGNDVGQSSARISQIASVDSMMRDEMTAMIGPMDAHSMSRVATFTGHWNILSLTPVAISAALRTQTIKESRNTMVRTGPVATQVGDCVAAILRYYNWTTTAVELFEDDLEERYHYFMAEGIYFGISNNNSEHRTKQIRLSVFEDDNGNYMYDSLLKNLKAQGRILLISADDFVVREFMKRAYEYGHSGEYAYVIIDLEDKLGSTPWEWMESNGTVVRDESIKSILESALIVTLTKQNTRKYNQFVYNMKSRFGRDLNKNMNTSLSQKIAHVALEQERRSFAAKSIHDYFEKNQYPAFFHDSLLMLAHLLNSSLNDESTDRSQHDLPHSWNSHIHKSSFPEGVHLLNDYVINKEFEGVTGKIAFDEVGDRLFDFSILDLDPLEDKFKIVAEYDSKSKSYREKPGMSTHWPAGAPPPDVPKCGFDGKKCAKERLTVIEAIVISVVSLAVVAVIASVNTYRRHKLKKELQSQLWRVYWGDITWPISPNSVLGGQLNGDMGLGDAPTESEPSLGEVISYYVPSLSPAVAAKRAHKRKRKWSSNSRKNERVFDNERKTSAGSLISDKVWGGLTTLGMYKDKTVVLKLTNRRKIELTRNVLMELKYMRDVTHEHLTRFEGACLEWPHICVLTEYCRKGSLRDILLNEEIQLDWMFRVSLMNDLVKGMCFLHGSAINCHGNLKSTNCVVDSRFVLKITDYGLHSFRSVPSTEESERQCEKKLWTAPELLRCASNSALGTQKGDVYSFGIILQEIALRKGTFYVGGMPLSCREIISKVRYGFQPFFRPMIDHSTLSEDVCNLMQRCWHEDPQERPDFNQTKKIIEKFNKENPGNLVENLLHRMEQYAINLEGLVEERTAAYMEEKRKADDLLYQMLPVSVVDRLKRGDSVPAEAFESVTICFTDIVGFTSLSAASNPMEIVSLLNDLYTCFDAIIDNFDVYKVETIGDAYMLVSGLPVRNGIRHAGEIARTALALLKAVSNFKIRHRPGDQLKLRIGIHTGPCCAGVVGLKMPRYCLFGDTVNTASRMESSGMPLAIHVSDSTKQLLDRYQCFKLQLRGEVPMKGKGTLTTYWLMEEILFDAQSLDESAESPLNSPK